MNQEELVENFMDPILDRVGKDMFLDKTGIKINQKHEIRISDKVKSEVGFKILAFYKEIIHFQFEWTYTKNKSIRGFIQILPIEVAVGDWEGKIYFKKRDPQYMEKFKVFDFFLPECCVGFYLSGKFGKAPEELYVFDREDVPIPLNVDIDGYIQLLYMARGFAYWQMALLDFQKHPSAGKAEVEKFKEWMPKVFPDFKWAEFVSLYKKVKLR